MTAVAKIVAINGSERDGNTADVLRHAAKTAEARDVEFEAVDLRAISMTRCGPCGDCNDRLVRCAQTDDVPVVVDKMIEADGLIYAAPVHGFGTSSLMQTFIERAGVGYLRFDRPLSNKVAGIVAVARRYSAGTITAQLIANVLLNRMILVGAGFPAEVHALHRGDAAEDEEGLTNVTRMVDRMIDMILLLKDYQRLSGKDDVLPIGDRNERIGLSANELEIL
ncbi:flavodoxin family protein [Actinophytocola gossypii]|uniref:Flavodoxin family protein n=1 Tax=Actinophytocola gossypii TaxID=2812003 RepID=A0ABT2JG87_9PSEU|nr:flavodoxin family protein [Actinophytocola gossypii]MCT2586801.1 flavodoxin family protein [Actinophytocola gossypii]